MDLVQRVIWLKSKGENEPIERFKNWIKESENTPASEFVFENEKYYWNKISSKDFEDIILEDGTDWILIYSASKEFEAIGKLIFYEQNLIGLKKEYITTLWILKSNIESFKVDEIPIQIWSPNSLSSPTHRIDFDLRQLLTRLKDPKVKLKELVDYKTSKTGTRRIR
jgi:hypothetical protein